MKILGSVHTAVAIALALAMPKSGSLAIAVLAKEWVDMPFLSEILSKNLSCSSLFPVRHSPFGIPLGITFQYRYH